MLLYFVWRRMIRVFPRTKNAFQIISTLPWPIYAADMMICWYANMCCYADMVPLCWYIFHRTENADCCPDYYPHCLGFDDSQWVNINVIVILMIVVIIIIITIHHYFLPFSLGPIPKNYWGVTQDDDISANARDVHDDADYHNDYNMMI